MLAHQAKRWTLEFLDFEIAGPFKMRPKKIEDSRGYFSEVFRAGPFEERAGPTLFVQENQSLSVKPGTIRGIHFQSPPAEQGKLVRCLSGSLIDVIVDLRRGSPWYGRWLGTELSGHQNNQLWVPVGFGHGFCTLEPNTVISYRVTNYYSAEHDCGLAWNDPDVAIRWPEIADPATLSAKDQTLPRLSNMPTYFDAGIIS